MRSSENHLKHSEAINTGVEWKHKTETLFIFPGVDPENVI